MTGTKKDRRVDGLFAKLTIVAFVIVLWLPLVRMNVSVSRDRENPEKRVLASKPGIDQLVPGRMQRFGRLFERYFNDNFGFRNTLIRINSILNMRTFGISPIRSVVAGEEGWLFYNNPDDGVSLNDYYGLASFNAAELSVLKRNITSMRRELAKRNVLFLFVMPASKHTIYPEYLPSRLGMMKGAVSRADQVDVAWTSGDGKSDDFFIDLRPSFVEAKKTFPYPLYYRLDSHWNDFGAFLCYREIMKRVRRSYPGTKTLDFSEYEISMSEKTGSGDLAHMMNMRGLLRDTEVTLKRIGLRGDKERGRVPAASKALLFGDSFADRLKPYLVDTFPTCVCYGSQFIDLRAVEKNEPDVVILEITERYLGELLKEPFRSGRKR
jgi:alginate O-acetyltransferase complex protein AlgJ